MRALLSLALFCAALPAAEPPKLRLEDEIRPVRYSVEMTLVPGAMTFDGSMDMDVALVKPASLIWLNAVDLTIRNATVIHGRKTLGATVEPGNDDVIGLRLPGEIPAGPARLHISYQGKISANNSAGVWLP